MIVFRLIVVSVCVCVCVREREGEGESACCESCDVTAVLLMINDIKKSECAILGMLQSSA
jgi:hypothetical protein